MIGHQSIKFPLAQKFKTNKQRRFSGFLPNERTHTLYPQRRATGDLGIWLTIATN